MFFQGEERETITKREVIIDKSIARSTSIKEDDSLNSNFIISNSTLEY